MVRKSRVAKNMHPQISDEIRWQMNSKSKLVEIIKHANINDFNFIDAVNDYLIIYSFYLHDIYLYLSF